MNKKAILQEFIRYVFIGGTAFFIDILILYFFKTRIFFKLGSIGIYISTALGFMSGLIFNYIFSITFVFKTAKEQNKGKNIFSFLLFWVIGVIGLFLTEAGMYAGVEVLNVNYLLTKVIVATLVLLWNYVARKVLIF
ncbi:MAG: GtrA family protein [Clostridium beijerinckii]